MATIEIEPYIYPGNDYHLRIGPLTALRTADGEAELQTGLLDVTALLSEEAEEGSAAIDASLEVVLTEEPGTGIYRGLFAGADLATQFDAYAVGQVLHVHFKRQQNFHASGDVIVGDPRSLG